MAPRTAVKLVVLVVAVALFAACCVAASEAVKEERPSGRPYRCFRPFKALDGFSPKFMHKRDNCAFDYLRIDGASAELSCANDVTDESGALSRPAPIDGVAPVALPDSGCQVTVRFNATSLVPKDRLPWDGARYTLKLGNGGKQIHYKGFDGKGFSVCCALIDGAQCEWQDVNETKRHVMRECALHDPAALVAGDGVQFSGVVTRPLHSYDAGKWNAFITFHRGTAADDDLVGKLVVPFEVPRFNVAANDAGAVAVVKPREEPAADPNAAKPQDL